MVETVAACRWWWRQLLLVMVVSSCVGIRDGDSGSLVVLVMERKWRLVGGGVGECGSFLVVVVIVVETVAAWWWWWRLWLLASCCCWWWWWWREWPLVVAVVRV